MRRRFTLPEQRIEAARELAADVAAARSELVTLRRAVGLPAAFVFVATPNLPTVSFVFRLISGRCPRCVGVRPGCRCGRIDAPPRRRAPWRTGAASGRGGRAISHCGIGSCGGIRFGRTRAAEGLGTASPTAAGVPGTPFLGTLVSRPQMGQQDRRRSMRAGHKRSQEGRWASMSGRESGSVKRPWGSTPWGSTR